jgi:hypothetical protein
VMAIPFVPHAGRIFQYIPENIMSIRQHACPLLP